MGSLRPPTDDVGRVIAHYGQNVRIVTRGGEITFKPPRRESWVVGDLVRIDARGHPKTVEPRRNELVRLSARKGLKQALASNLDWLVVVTACGESFKPGLIDRFIVAASHAGIRPMIVLNKNDLPGADERQGELESYQRLGFPAHAMSALYGEGMETLAAALKDSISALVGHSGVGKTSILNRLAPGVNRAVGDVHEETERGRHVTTSSLMVELPAGGAIIDSPGIRQFSPTGLEPHEVARHFPGFAEWIGRCRFRDCAHLTEPGCAITKAVEDGHIDADRYASYTRILEAVKQSEQPHWRRAAEE